MRVILHVSPREPVFAPSIRDKKDAVSPVSLKAMRGVACVTASTPCIKDWKVGMPVKGSCQPDTTIVGKHIVSIRRPNRAGLTRLWPTPPSIFLNKILIPAPTPINQRGACGGRKAGINRQVTKPPSLILSSLASITHIKSTTNTPTTNDTISLGITHINP